jgi:glucokinase
MIIAGDIGGTKTNIALFESDGRRLGKTIAQQSFPSSKFSSLEEILRVFLARHRPSKVTRACFGVAGPVIEGRVETPNLAWVVSDKNLAVTLKIEHVGILNDLEATAYGVEIVPPSSLYTLNGEDEARDGHRALIAAGTGLGTAAIFWDGLKYHPMASEGGHMDFAPRNEREIKLLRYLTEKVGGHVSYERVLSGPGLFNIYSFLREQNFAAEPAWLAEEIKGDDPSAAVSKAALANKCKLAVEALDIFVEIYGAMAGNLALLLKPDGGVFVGGGIAPKIIEKLKDGTFVKAYRDKGRMSWIVESTPVRVLMDDKTALYGAALYALSLRG